MRNTDKTLNTISLVAGITAIAAAMLLVVFLVLSLAGLIHPRKETIHLYTPDRCGSYVESGVKGSYPELLEGNLHDGHVFSVLALPRYSKVGQYENKPEYAILDETGADVTDRYEIIEEFGTIEILPVKIYLSSAETSKIYDGTPLELPTVKLRSGALLWGHTLEAELRNELIDPGVEDAILMYRILDADGYDVTDQYEIQEDFGLLEVLPIPLTLSTESARKQYDGKPISADGWEHIAGELQEGHRLEMTMPTTLTQVGSVANEGKARVLDAQGNDVTRFYDLQYQFGTLTVHPMSITIRTDSAQKVYDGTPLSCDGYTIIAGSLWDGDEISIACTSITEVGYSENFVVRCAVYRDTEEQGRQEVTEYYQISYDFGTLKITAE